MAGNLQRLFALTALAGAALLAISVSMAQEATDKGPNFVTSDQCIGCHSNMVTASGKELSIGHTWRASLMAQAAKDPYWMAGVRREIADRPHMQEEIEDTCSVCHMPMFRTTAVANGGSGEIVRYLDGGFSAEELAPAQDGVSCTACHQISADNLGEHSSFSGGYVINPSTPGHGKVYGPYDVDAGLQRVMHSASALAPNASTHVQKSELCATCHTLFTPAMDGSGEVIGEFPEQVPYLEWQHSRYAETRSCQDCHMPQVDGETPIASVLGEPRKNVSQHVFRGGNYFMLTLLNKYREELGVTVPEGDLAESAAATLAHLQNKSAGVRVGSIDVAGNEAVISIEVSNRAGHKLPTAYPSRRAWLHVTVMDESGQVIFESGAMENDGSVRGNDNDIDPRAFEPHYAEISSADQVQIYEPIIIDHAGHITTSLLSGVTYTKDNRLLPEGFDNATASEAVRVRGEAVNDKDFSDGGDSVRYRVSLPEGVSTIRVSAELNYQTIGYRWAKNLASYDAPETKRFVGYYDDNASISAVTLAKDSADYRR